MTAWWLCPACGDPVEADDGLDEDTDDSQPCDLCAEDPVQADQCSN